MAISEQNLNVTSSAELPRGKHHGSTQRVLTSTPRRRRDGNSPSTRNARSAAPPPRSHRLLAATNASAARAARPPPPPPPPPPPTTTTTTPQLQSKFTDCDRSASRPSPATTAASDGAGKRMEEKPTEAGEASSVVRRKPVSFFSPLVRTRVN